MKFTKQEAAETETAVKEVLQAFPRNKRGEFIGHFNDIFLFLEAAKQAAPDETTPKTD